MNKKGEINNVLKIAGAIMMILLIVAVVVIVMFLTLSSITSSITTSSRQTQLSANTSTVYAMNYSKGYTLSTYSNCVPTITVTNSSGYPCDSNNYTLSACTITAKATASIGCNNTVWYINGYITDSRDTDNLVNNVTTGTTNFFTQIPTIMIILGICALIGAVVLIIYMVGKFGGNKTAGL